MTVKTNGAEFKRFYNDSSIWPRDSYHEDEIITIDGVKNAEYGIDYEKINDGAVMTIQDGIVYLDESFNTVSFEMHFKRWRKAQSVDFLICEVPKEKAEDIRKYVISQGGKVK